MKGSPEPINSSQEKERNKGPPGASGDEGYFGAVGKRLSREGKKAEADTKPEKIEEKEEEEEKEDNSKHIFQGPPVSSPLTDDFPAPEGAGAAYEGKAEE
jgi:hypothetical protein